MPDPVEPGGEEREALAAEYALGVLEGEDLASAQRLLVADRDFAEQVEWWNYRLANMAEAAGSYAPSEQVWPAIARRLEESRDEAPHPLSPPAGASPRGYSGGALAAAMAGAAALAAAITLFVALPRVEPEPPVPAPTAAAENRLIAQLQNEDGTINLAGLVEQDAGRISLNIAGLEPGSGRAAELWVVPADGVPRSLGRIPEEGQFSRDLSEEEQGLLAPGSALAVTYEDSATIPHPAPTSDILIVSELSRI